MRPIFHLFKFISRQHFRRNHSFFTPYSYFLHSPPETPQNPDANLGNKLHNILNTYRDSPTKSLELALGQCEGLTLTEDFIMDVLKRHQSDWKSAYGFFNWVRDGPQIALGVNVYNEMLDILGKMRRFEEVNIVFDEMSKREGLLNEETFWVLVSRYAAAHKVEDAIRVVFYTRRKFGFEIDSVAFQKLLMYLCRYKHVEIAETLLHRKGGDFDVDVKTLNIVLNGWCVLGNVREAKRFWKDIMRSKFKPDLFTYGTMIKALTKKGKLGTALKLYRGMWERSCKPDVVICNCVIDALCFKKRIPEALEVFREMNERGCLPNAATYNSLIKHLCKIRRMEKVWKLLDEMQQRGGNCIPTDVTFNYLLKSLRKPEEIPGILGIMERNGCELNADTYNLILKLFVDWNCEDEGRQTWDSMEEKGLGPDQKSYTIMIHWLYDKGRYKDSLNYFGEMISKGMLPEPRTKILVDAMNKKLKGNETENLENSAASDSKSSKPFHESDRNREGE